MMNSDRNEIEVGTVDIRMTIRFTLGGLIFLDGNHSNHSNPFAFNLEVGSVKTVHLPDYASIFTAEIHALHMALDIIRRARSKDCVVFADSLSSLQAIESCKVENPLIVKILKDHNQLINSGKSMTFCWIPSHVGI